MGAEVQDSRIDCLIIFCACVVVMMVVMMVVKPVENSRINRGENGVLPTFEMCAIIMVWGIQVI
jgi:hypothetical protein